MAATDAQGTGVGPGCLTYAARRGSVGGDRLGRDDCWRAGDDSGGCCGGRGEEIVNRLHAEPLAAAGRGLILDEMRGQPPGVAPDGEMRV